MYEDTYTKFNASDFKYGGYDAKDIVAEPPFAEWDYGDTFIIRFNLAKYLDQYEDLSNYFLIFRILNSRHEAVYEGCGDIEKLVDENGVFAFMVNSDLSQKLIPGSYTCSVTLKSSEEQCTFFKNCRLHVR